MSLVKHANHPIRYSRRRTVSSSCRASRADRGALSTPSRAVSKPKSGREARTKLVEAVLYSVLCIRVSDLVQFGFLFCCLGTSP